MASLQGRVGGRQGWKQGDQLGGHYDKPGERWGGGSEGSEKQWDFAGKPIGLNEIREEKGIKEYKA